VEKRKHNAEVLWGNIHWEAYLKWPTIGMSLIVYGLGFIRGLIINELQYSDRTAYISDQ